MFSTPLENCIYIFNIFDIITLFTAELEKPEIGM